MNKINLPSPVIILADGEMPKKPMAIKKLHTAQTIICCDGAAEKLLHYGLHPSYIVGDLDSVSNELKEKFKDKLIQVTEQETNDLTKAVKFCADSGVKELCILGATGRREDHTLGNISLLANYADLFNHVEMISNYGIFYILSNSSTIPSIPGQQISIFALNQTTIINTENLKYPINSKPLKALWEGTLNEALENNFTIQFDKGKILIYIAF